MSSVDYFFADTGSHLAGKRPERLTSAEDTYYVAVEKAGGAGSYAQPTVFWNHEPHTVVAGSGVYEHSTACKGFAVGMNRHTRLGSLSPNDAAVTNTAARMLLSSRWFGHSAVFKIPGESIPEQMSEQDMKLLIAQAAAEIDQSRAKAEQARVAEQLLGPSRRSLFRDPIPWQAGITGHGHFAGLYRSDGGIGQPRRDCYYLAVHSDSGVVGDALNGFALGNPRHTIGQLIDSNAYVTARSYSARNANRILCHMANVLHLNRNLVRRHPDQMAAVGLNDTPTPELLEGLYADSEYNTLYQPSPNSDILVYYNACSPMAASSAHHGRVAFMRNAREGIDLYNLDLTRDFTAVSHGLLSEGASVTRLLEHQNPHGAMPVGTGRHRQTTLTYLRDEDAPMLFGAYHWHGKPVTLQTEEPAEIVSLNRRLHIYRAMDPRTASILSLITGVEERAVTHLRPLSVVIPADAHEL